MASHVAATAAEVHAEHIMIAGDPRARSALLGHLKPALREMAVTVAAELPADGAAMAAAAEEITTSYSERAVVSRFGTWHSRMADGADGAAVAGLGSTVAALADGRAAEVLLMDDPGSAATAWTGPGRAELALTRDTITERGVAAPVRDRADAAIARARTRSCSSCPTTPSRRTADSPRRCVTERRRHGHRKAEGSGPP